MKYTMNLNSLEKLTEEGDSPVRDYLVVKTENALVQKKLPQSFYIPYIERYILDFDKANRVVHCKDGLGILENS